MSGREATWLVAGVAACAGILRLATWETMSWPTFTGTVLIAVGTAALFVVAALLAGAAGDALRNHR